MTAAAKRLIFQPSGHNNQERLNMDLSRLSFCWRNSQIHLKNSLCLPGMEKLSAITQSNTRHGLNSDNLHLYALYMLVDQFEYTCYMLCFRTAKLHAAYCRHHLIFI